MEERSSNRADQTQLDRGYNCRHVAPFHLARGGNEARAPKRAGGVEDGDGHVSAFLMQVLR